MTTITKDGMPPKLKYFSPFVDVPQSNDFNYEINNLNHMGIVVGSKVSSGRAFKPKSKITRDQMIVFIYRILGSLKFTAPKKSPFKDVKTSYSFYKEITWANSAGITIGYKVTGGREFRPLRPISRGEMAAFLFKATPGTKTYKAPTRSPFRDMNTKSSFYREIMWMYETGVTSGYATSKGAEFRSSIHTKREHMAAFLHRWITHLKERPSPSGSKLYNVKSPLTPELTGTISFNNLVAKRFGISTNYETFREVNSKGWEKWFNDQFAMTKSVDTAWMKPYVASLPMLDKNNIQSRSVFLKATGTSIDGNGNHFGAVQRIGSTVLRSIYSPRLINESLTSFWLDHFSVPYEGLGSPAVFNMDLWMRDKAGTNIPDIFWSMLRTPKLYSFLDADTNQVGKINENLARELIELYTTGLTVNVEEDIRQLAILLTGHARSWDGKTDLIFSKYTHAFTTKPLKILGRSYPNANESQAMQSVEKLIYDLTWDARTIKFISTKLVSHYVSDTPTSAMVNEVVETYKRTGGDVKSMLRAMIVHPDFVKNIGSKWKRPFEMMTSHQRSLKPVENLAEILKKQKVPTYYLVCSELVTKMQLAGHNPRNNHSPKGNDNLAKTWINSSSLLHTINALNSTGSLSPKSYKVSTTFGKALGYKDGSYSTTAKKLVQEITGFTPNSATITLITKVLSNKSKTWDERVNEASSKAYSSPYGFIA